MRHKMKEDMVTITKEVSRSRQYKTYSRNEFFMNPEIKYTVDHEKITFSLPTLEDYKRVLKPQVNSSGGVSLTIFSDYDIQPDTYEIESEDSDYIELYYTPL